MSNQKYPQTAATTSTGTTLKKGRAHYSHAKADARKDRKRDEAFARDVIYANLTTAERIKRVQSRRGESKREMARITK